MLIAICEDTLQDMERALDLCDRFAREESLEVQTLSYPHAEKLLADPKARQAEVFLLDIIMEGKDGPYPAGIETARTLRAEGYAGAIIFMTTSEDFYPEGFEVGAAHYLVKPLSYEALAAALQRALFVIKPQERMITVPVDRIQVPIAQSLIRYAEVYGRETILHTDTERIRVLLPLKKIEALLGGPPFLRCYRSYIINMDYIKAIKEDHFVMEDGANIPISLRTKSQLKEKYLAYRLSRVPGGRA